MTSGAEPSGRTANADWIRALQRTASITPSTTRTLAVVIDEIAVLTPYHVALSSEAETLTYAELSCMTHRVARWAAARGLRAGDTVALMMDNSAAYPALWIGLSRIGIVTALINTHLTGRGLTHCLTISQARFVIADENHRRCAVQALAGTAVTVLAHDAWTSHEPDANDPPAVERPLAETALLIFTSGTTGLPKAARVSHYRIMMWSAWFAGILDTRPSDRLYGCLPMYHSVGGVVGIGAMLVSGATAIVRKSFSVRDFWADIAASQATIFQHIGELCRYLVNAPGEPETGHALRLVFGNGLRADVWAAFERRFAIPRIIEFYAATEGSFSLFNLEGRPGSIGRIPPFMAHRTPVALVTHDSATHELRRDADGFCRRCARGVVGEAIGRIALGDNGLAARFEGYTSVDETERKILRDVFQTGDAWFRTGDLMRQDAEGFYYFVDRIGDTFRWKGENVATTEVADAILACPGVEEAAVYGVQVPFADGRAGMAALVVTPAFDAASLARRLETSLPRYARPIFLRIRQALAATATHKTQKCDLQKEGYDPTHVMDPLFILDGATYVPLDVAAHQAIMAGARRF